MPSRDCLTSTHPVCLVFHLVDWLPGNLQTLRVRVPLKVGDVRIEVICFEQKKNINENKIWSSVDNLAFGASGTSVTATARRVRRKPRVDNKHARNKKESWMIGTELA